MSENSSVTLIVWSCDIRHICRDLPSAFLSVYVDIFCNHLKKMQVFIVNFTTGAQKATVQKGSKYPEQEG